MTSQVFFHDARASAKKNRLDKVKSLFARAQFPGLIAEGDRVAIKVHWGEPGNVGFIPPPYVRTIVNQVKKAGGIPYVTDTNTLYTGMRRDAVCNLEAAARDGYSQLTLGAPIVVADGVKGKDYREIELKDSIVGKAKIASGILDADAMVVISHVKSHMLFGFGGALKNLGMGCATPAGKQILHSDLRPRVDADRCQGDGICLKSCPEECIEMVDARGGKKVARIDSRRCVGCGECTAACPHGAIPINWTTSPEAIQKKTAEYARASISHLQGKVGFVNLIIQVTPDCDCCSWNDTAFVSDVGFAASTDPVAIDTASADLVAGQPAAFGSKAHGKQGDLWRAVYDIDYRIIFEYGQKIGLGSREYELVRL